MKKLNKDLYYKTFAQVSVNGLVMSNTSKCYKCNDRLQEFTVFIGEGQKLSTMFTSCCGVCLPIMVKKAIKTGRDTADKQFKLAEEKLYKESLSLVRKTKLNKIDNERS